jgi:hypothetical protein
VSATTVKARRHARRFLQHRDNGELKVVVDDLSLVLVRLTWTETQASGEVHTIVRWALWLYDTYHGLSRLKKDALKLADELS